MTRRFERSRYLPRLLRAFLLSSSAKITDGDCVTDCSHGKGSNLDKFGNGV